MSRNNAHHRMGNAVTSTWRRAREAAARLQPGSGKVMPLARNAGVAAKHRADRARGWAAPQVDKASQAVQDSLAPKVSSLLSAAARRLEPDKPQRQPQRWRKVAGVSATTAAATAFTAAVRSRRNANATTAAEDLGEAEDGVSASAERASNGDS
jgi:hypothetical protein